MQKKRTMGWTCLLAQAGVVWLAAMGWAWAAPAAPSGQGRLTALLVSDIHLDPFWDPSKVAQLAAAPASGWKAILAAPAAPDREQRFAALAQGCHARGSDTPYPLFQSSLDAMRLHASGARFITVSGDLAAHSFQCKYKALFPQAPPADYRAFVEKTIEFVLNSLREGFPGVPIYTALGNNDTDCDDYKIDAHGEFLAETGRIVAGAGGFLGAERRQVEETFAAGGYFSAPLPLPHARILVLDDLFMARKYATCSGQPDPDAARVQIAWLREQLERARKDEAEVWVMAHIPPGVDPYSTTVSGANVCAGQAPQTFLSSESLAQTLAAFGDVIQLALFAHTHMDELRLLVAAKGPESFEPVAVKLVPSISPIDGNNPSFVVAVIDRATAVLTDYRVYAASNQTGIGATWQEEYDFARDYQEPAFSPASVARLVDTFKADPSAQAPTSRSYLAHYFVGGLGQELAPIWPQYVCAVANFTQDGYRTCVCPAAP